MTKFYPLTYAQKGIWNIENFHPNTNINIIAGTLQFSEELNFELLEKAINILVKKTTHYGFILPSKTENLFSM